MKKSALLPAMACGLFAAFAPAVAFASGSYAARPPQPPKMGDAMTKLDREKYGLGQKVYEGGVMTAGAGEAGAQAARLQSVQMKLPADVAKTKDLAALAGKLTSAQLDALEYFVEQRFAMKK